MVYGYVFKNKKQINKQERLSNTFKGENQVANLCLTHDMDVKTSSKNKIILHSKISYSVLWNYRTATKPGIKEELHLSNTSDWIWEEKDAAHCLQHVLIVCSWKARPFASAPLLQKSIAALLWRSFTCESCKVFYGQQLYTVSILCHIFN